MSIKTLRIWTVLSGVFAALCLVVLVCIYVDNDGKPVDTSLQLAVCASALAVGLNFWNLRSALRKKRTEEKNKRSE